MSFLKKILGSAIEEGINEFTEYLKDKQDDDYYINLGGSVAKFPKRV